MINEKYNQIIDEVYRNYSMSCIKETKKQEREMKEKNGWNTLCLEPYFESKEKFISLIKTDSEFSKKWGLKIEERELKHKERIQLSWTVSFPHRKNEVVPDWWNIKELTMDEQNIPTKLITITYKNEKTEVYE